MRHVLNGDWLNSIVRIEGASFHEAFARALGVAFKAIGLRQPASLDTTKLFFRILESRYSHIRIYSNLIEDPITGFAQASPS